MYCLLRPALFQLDPERAHDWVFSLLKLLQTARLVRPKAFIKNSQTLFGVDFPNPVGLAAGLDKNGDCIRALSAFGFGFIEVGTVTPRPQGGNPKPRLFRLTEDKALINRMGFNNHGLEKLVKNLSNISVSIPIGVNIGKNKDTPLAQAVEDYVLGYQKVAPLADYVTINLSSPNTPDLRKLQFGQALEAILQPLSVEQAASIKKTPILVKIAPDLDEKDLYPLLDTLMKYQISGIIATNTTMARPDNLKSIHRRQAGGLSGAPLLSTSQTFVKNIYQYAGADLPIIAVGGIMSGKDAQLMLESGAKLVQIYSGFIYRGPRLVREIIECL